VTSTEWNEIKALFNSVLDKPANERASFLSSATEDNPTLRETVARLVASHDEDDAFLEVAAVATYDDPSTDDPVGGGRAGSYSLLREIGRGGMGTVHLAVRDDGQFRHKVAVKLVKRGMDTDLILRRFRYERQILADLDHPNIARLLDGGTTTDGRPYFVMEYIEGEPIDVYCAAHNLPVEERLRLFLAVCAAVQYAHQNLIVHRDLKTSNIIVTVSGIPKLLDFGIAKLLGPSREDTATDATLTLRALTPEYASPEQVRGDPITTASDVYSLGVLLYELLAGQRPYEVTSRRPDDIARAVCETDPVPPSAAVTGEHADAVRRALLGDLDNIVLMAMQKDPRRRYASVEQLSDDINSHLVGRPVSARRDTRGYRASKFIRRNRVAAATGAIVFVSLVAGLATTMWQAKVARAERARAERRFGEVRSLATSFLFELHDAIAPLPGSTPARALLVKQALVSLDGLAKEANGDPTLQRDLAAAYEKVGNVQGNSYNFNLGDTEGALASYRKSMDIRRRLARDNPTSIELQTELAKGYQGLADMDNTVGELVAAAAGYRSALAIREKLQARSPADQVNRAALADIYNSLGDTQGMDGYANLGDVAGALESYRRSVRLREEILQSNPQEIAYKIGLGKSLMNLGFLQGTAGDTAASRNVRHAITILEETLRDDPNDTNRRIELLAGYVRLRYVLADAGRSDEAIAVDRLTIAKLDSMLTADPSNSMLKRNLGATYNYLGRDLRSAQNAASAIKAHAKSLEIAERLAVADPKSSEHRHDVAISHFLLAEALSDMPDYAAALNEYHVAADEKEKLRVVEKTNTRHADDLALIYAGMAKVQTATGKFTAASASIDNAIPLAEAAAARSRTSMKARVNLASVYMTAGELHRAMARSVKDASMREHHLREGRAHFARTLLIWKEIERERPLSEPQVKGLIATRRELSACDSALRVRGRKGES
jgi:non-specific serine/threonine protein kinase/serine/threonine-protein kinase